MKKQILFAAIILCQVSIFARVTETKTADTLKTPTIVPVILNGEAHGDGKKDRMHVDVTRHQTNSRSRQYINYNTNCWRS
jgi:hypothetical protein